jgi:hypothetical protein
MTTTFIQAAIENDRGQLVRGIRHLFNCRYAEIDQSGRIAISNVANPQSVHWLGEDSMARIERALKAGDI